MPINTQVVRGHAHDSGEPARQRPASREDDEMGADRASQRRRRRSSQTHQESLMWFPSITAWFESLDRKKSITVLTLVYINLINYMDRSTVAGMIDSIKNDPYFQIHHDQYLGLLQTAFVFCYMIFAPLFGYLGDRYDRTWIIGFGITFWSISTLVGSFMTNFWMFLLFRAFVGIGEASYSTIAPAIISDLFSKDTRSKVLALFYFAIPVGTGLGYMVGAEVADRSDDWRWGLRMTPFMGLLAILGVWFVMEDPPRGVSEGAHLRPTSPRVDLNALRKNKSFIFSTIAFTCVTFSAGALMWWGPQFAFYGAKAACGSKAGCENIMQSDVSYKFGIVMTFAGLIGVPAGSYVSQKIRHRVPNADPIVSGTSLLLSVPVLFIGFVVARYNVGWCYTLTFLAGLLLNCNWAIVSDMTLYIVIPTRRSLASATQILTSHAFGDAISPYLVGVLADLIRPIISTEDSADTSSFAAGKGGFTPKYYDIEFRSLQYALFLSCFFQAFGALFFFITSFYVLDDKALADMAITSGVSDDPLDDENDDTVPIVRAMANQQNNGLLYRDNPSIEEVPIVSDSSRRNR
ncbi:protein spinster-like [Tigriopus californicus]|uniref:protein spinster-like n=1 Tax=Tigriopus californicus TaxID=6832 RepID=UPI0027DA129C|nr:protein spinster-like [Tigriopus californicus]